MVFLICHSFLTSPDGAVVFRHQTYFEEIRSRMCKRGFMSKVYERASAQKNPGVLLSVSNAVPFKAKCYKVNTLPSELAGPGSLLDKFLIKCTMPLKKILQFFMCRSRTRTFSPFPPKKS